jgi:Zn-dependent metalloprotease
MLHKLLAAVFIILLNLPAFSQNNDRLDDLIQKNGYLNFGKIKAGLTLKSSAENERLLITDIVGKSGKVGLKKIYEEVFGDRSKIAKYQLYCNGIELRGAEYVIFSGGGNIKCVYGFFADVSAKNPDMSEAAKRRSILAAKANFKIQHQNVASKGNLDMKIADAGFVYYFNNQSLQFEPAWQIRIEAPGMAIAENFFIDPVSGGFLGAENLICSINFPGIAQTQYSGIRNIITDAPTAAGPFRLQELRNNVLIRTRDNNHNLVEVTGATDFFDNDNNWTLAEHGSDRAAFDAHWGAETVYDYWLNVHNRNSINNQGMAIESYVHVGNNFFNAFWLSNRMYYGDGIGGVNPLTTLDVCAHEFGHGIDQYTGDLKYEKESGALDEGFADIWAACVEAWATPNKQRWLIGEEFFGGPLRNMANPNQFGQPDTYLGANWFNVNNCTPTDGNDYCGVHTNSGVLNFWFFLLSEGGTGANDIGNAYNVNGLGIDVAARIAYRTKLMLNTSLADFALARAVSEQAAEELFGAGSCERAAVARAWYAVGVGPDYALPPVNPSVVLNYSPDCEVHNLAFNTGNSSLTPVSVSWSVSSGLVVTPTSANGLTAAVTNPNACGGGIVTATANLGCGRSVTAIYNFTPCQGTPTGTPVNIYNPILDNAPAQLCIGAEWDAWLTQPYANAQNYIWATAGNKVQIVSGQGTTQVRLRAVSSGNEAINCTAVTPCIRKSTEYKNYTTGLVINWKTHVLSGSFDCNTYVLTGILSLAIGGATYQWAITTYYRNTPPTTVNFVTATNTVNYSYPTAGIASQICVIVTTACGTSEQKCVYYTYDQVCRARSFGSGIVTEPVENKAVTVSPNPTTGVVFVQPDSKG